MIWRKKVTYVVVFWRLAKLTWPSKTCDKVLSITPFVCFSSTVKSILQTDKHLNTSRKRSFFLAGLLLCSSLKLTRLLEINVSYLLFVFLMLLCVLPDSNFLLSSAALSLHRCRRVAQRASLFHLSIYVWWRKKRTGFLIYGEKQSGLHFKSRQSSWNETVFWLLLWYIFFSCFKLQTQTQFLIFDVTNQFDKINWLKYKSLRDTFYFSLKWLFRSGRCLNKF